MIIELFGLPGAGKTFIINKIRGNAPVGVESENKLKKVVLKFVKKLSLLTPMCMKLRRKMVVLLNMSELKPLYIKNTVHSYIDNIVLVCFGYKYVKRDLFMDEGILHRVVSFAVNYDLNSELVLNLVSILLPYIKLANVFYLLCDEKECLDSISKRNRHICKMDELNEEDLFKFIHSYKIYFDLIEAKYNFATITRDNYSLLAKAEK